MDDSKEILKKFLSYLVFLFFIFGISLYGCSKVNRQFGLKDDNPIEEAIETFIESESGLNIDLSPESRE